MLHTVAVIQIQGELQTKMIIGNINSKLEFKRIIENRRIFQLKESCHY